MRLAEDFAKTAIQMAVIVAASAAFSWLYWIKLGKLCDGPSRLDDRRISKKSPESTHS